MTDPTAETILLRLIAEIYLTPKALRSVQNLPSFDEALDFLDERDLDEALADAGRGGRREDDQ